MNSVLEFNPKRVAWIVSFTNAFNDIRFWPTTVVSANIGIRVNTTERFRIFDQTTYGYMNQLTWFCHPNASSPDLEIVEITFDPNLLPSEQWE